MSDSKQIRLNVNIFFNVPKDYVVTDTESIEFVGKVLLRGAEDEILSTRPMYHETIESLDMDNVGQD